MRAGADYFCTSCKSLSINIMHVHKGGFPHSDIHGSKLIRSSPWLNAAYHVLHRLCVPRHSLNALITLDSLQ